MGHSASMGLLFGSTFLTLGVSFYVAYETYYGNGKMPGSTEFTKKVFETSLFPDYVSPADKVTGEEHNEKSNSSKNEYSQSELEQKLFRLRGRPPT